MIKGLRRPWAVMLHSRDERDEAPSREGNVETRLLIVPRYREASKGIDSSRDEGRDEGRDLTRRSTRLKTTGGEG